jgi:hypothetical protein
MLLLEQTLPRQKLASSFCKGSGGNGFTGSATHSFLLSLSFKNIKILLTYWPLLDLAYKIGQG